MSKPTFKIYKRKSGGVGWIMLGERTSLDALKRAVAKWAAKHPVMWRTSDKAEPHFVQKGQDWLGA